MAIDQHLVWACGHFIVLASSAIVLLQTVLFRNVSVAAYKLAYTGALLSYGIVINKSLGIPQFNLAWARRAFLDENVQYALLAFYWWISTPINLTILPFATFSLFHCLTFARQNILARFAPPRAAAGPDGQRPPPQGIESIMRRIQLWVKQNYDSAMRFVAYAELAILARVVLGALTFRLSFISPVFLAHFIRLRYHASTYSRAAVNDVGSRIDGFAASRGGPVAQGWARVRAAVVTWGGGNLVNAQPQPQAGPAQGNAQAGRR